ncbi:VWA domain-containing protein [Ancylobacter sp. 6x-1]|uniref:VWA domain-containing protein n=1 Tax=Ancylobacter crimeensis TaxID=2579147 RepID=A0ABT0DC71_9HYPH|nr:VWA domain-containing protein [Ancylobacter crimeensis]MCK0197577.1 VWA domain-containing protein [Ancylobacter crimeensis]
MVSSKITRGSRAVTGEGALDAFLQAVGRHVPMPGRDTRRRLIFGLDATMSRQPTWDLACSLQAGMFEEAEALGGLDIQLVYYRGLDECRVSGWSGSAEHLGRLMARIDCRGGRTQIGRMIRHVGREATKGPVKAFVFVGDALEEPVDALCAEAGELALLGVPAFLFQEGHDRAVTRAFREVARMTGGAWSRFDAGSAHQLRDLLRAVAAYAAGGEEALLALAAAGTGSARALIGEMRSRS